MIGNWFGGDRRRRANMEKARERTRAIRLAASTALEAAILTVELDGSISDCTDGIGLFPPDGTAPKTVDRAIELLGGTRDIKDTVYIVRARAERPDSVREGSGDRNLPVVAIPARPGRVEEVRWVTVEARRVEAPDDPMESRSVLVFRDVTEDRRRNDAMERRLALMNRALDRAPFGLVVLDADGQVRDTNTAFRRLIGGRPVAGKDFTDLFVTDDQERLRETLAILSESPSDTPTVAPIDLRLNAEEERIVTIYANRTVVPDRERHGVLIHAIDATERKRLETQFAQSQKMQAVGQLAGGIAHDFNNVLTAIIGFCDLLLQRHQPGDPSFADVMQIQQNANRAAGLTRQLLAFSRQQTIRSRLVDVTDTLAELANLLRRLLGESIELTMIHGRDLWGVRGDRGQLEQVVINLAVNARDAMDRGGRLIVQTDNFSSDRPYQMREEVMPAGEYVMITVTDTGMGMTPEVLGRIFEPFYTTKEVGQGTGLGLAMVYGSVSQMGGFVVAHSDGPGKGASFSLYLPRARVTAKDAADAAQSGETAELTDDTGGERILLVEDEDAVRLFSARALRSKGYEVTEARTGEIALEILADASFDLLITDMVMPKVDGATLIREARRAMPDLPVICISGYTRESVAKEVAELPKVSFLSKPFSLKQLSTRVRSSLESAHKSA